MSAIKSFFDKTFFLNGTEGIILFLVCIAAAVCTVVVIALAITVIVVIKRRKREGVAEVAEPAQQATPEGQTEQAEAVTEDTPLQVLAETSTEAPEGQAEQAPAVTSAKKVKIASGAAFVAARYDKSFTAKLIQSDDVLKGWYSSLKNALLGYKKVNSRISWHTDSINRGRIKLAKFAIRGKTLRLYLALNPDGYADTKYKVERAESKRYEEVPCLYRIKNARRAKYALELIATLAEKFGLQPVEREQVDYYLPYEENEPLLERGLIKEIIYKAEEVQVEEDGEAVEEIAAAEVPDEEPTEVTEEGQPAEAAEEISEAQPAEEAAEEEQPAEQPMEESPVTQTPGEIPAEDAEEVSAEPVTQVEVVPAEETEAEPYSREIDDVQSPEEETKDEDGVEVVGVMFRRRGKKVYWFDPDGKTWEKGEIALYKTAKVPPQEVIVVENTKISPEKLHLPLKPLYKAPRHPQTGKK